VTVPATCEIQGKAQGPNVSTTPLRHPIAVMGVVDTFRQGYMRMIYSIGLHWIDMTKGNQFKDGGYQRPNPGEAGS
jgi:hypothetical protein